MTRPVAWTTTAALLLLCLSSAGCRLARQWRSGPPAGGPEATALAATALPPGSEASPTAEKPTSPVTPKATKATTPEASPSAVASAAVTATAAPTATEAVALPLPGRRLPASAWHTLVKAPGLPDMSVAPDVGPNTRFAVVTGNGALNTLRSQLLQPANAWVTGIATDTVLVAALLGQRRGQGHDLTVLDVATEEGVVNIAVQLAAPGEWIGGDAVFPVHLIAIDRSALPPGPLAFHFFDADALGQADRAPAFDVALDPIDPAEDSLAQWDGLLIQTASEPAPPPAAGATPTIQP
jgi:hypothetical protein